ncbi:MAG: hypothetical protein H3C47_06815 [Candidatus Cloacimonetes bacterium]|nr:hypothetical protein [Candidatus Cloacimonadota bacterium]
MKQQITHFIIGILFGIGLLLSGMTQPGKVIGFLDIFGNWVPDLAFVMIGAILINSIAHKFLMRRGRPLFGTGFNLPSKKDLDRPLIQGSILFGIGWGLAGFCPGPAIVSIGGLQTPAILFGIGLVIGASVFIVKKNQVK